MAIKNENKLKKLLDDHRPGSVTLASWLEAQGISRALQQYYYTNGWLEPVGRGALKRPGDQVDWRGGLYALVEQAHLAVHVGAISALSLKGFAHYIRMGREKVFLFSPQKARLPAWYKNHDWGVDIEHIRTHFLPANMGVATPLEIGYGSPSSFVPNMASDPERAILECLYLAPQKFGLLETFQVMEGLVNLRPKVVQQLLEACMSIKVKRLFLYMAEKAGHQWVHYVDCSHINLGEGDRSIVKNGVYVAKHRISLPRELVSL